MVMQYGPQYDVLPRLREPLSGIWQRIMGARKQPIDWRQMLPQNAIPNMIPQVPLPTMGGAPASTAMPSEPEARAIMEDVLTASYALAGWSQTEAAKKAKAEVSVMPADQVVEQAYQRLAVQASPEARQMAEESRTRVQATKDLPTRPGPPPAPQFQATGIGSWLGGPSPSAPQGPAVPITPGASGDFMGAISEAAMPSPTAQPQASAGGDAYVSTRQAHIAQRQAAARKYYDAYQQALASGDRDLADRYLQYANTAEADAMAMEQELAKYQMKGAGGVSADTAAQIAASDRRAAAAEAFQREQEMQRVKEAMVNTRSRLMDLQAAAQQQGNQFVAENARWSVPAGSQYAPGREPDSMLAQAVTKAGYTFTPRERPTMGVDPFAQRKLIDDQVAQILEQMKSWGTGG